jgi:hypothetical protein
MHVWPFPCGNTQIHVAHRWNQGCSILQAGICAQRVSQADNIDVHGLESQHRKPKGGRDNSVGTDVGPNIHKYQTVSRHSALLHRSSRLGWHWSLPNEAMVLHSCCLVPPKASATGHSKTQADPIQLFQYTASSRFFCHGLLHGGQAKMPPGEYDTSAPGAAPWKKHRTS